MLPSLYNRNINSFMHDVENHFSKVVDNFFSPPSLGDLKNKLKTSSYPKLDVFNNEGTYMIQASVPGVKSDDLMVETFEESGIHYVRISGHMSQEYTDFKDGEPGWYTKELCRRAFTRTLTIPENLEGDPDAKVKDGILTLAWKYKPEAPPGPATRVIPLKKE